MRSKFTLIEVMIVVAIVGIITAICVPAFIEAKRQSTPGENRLYFDGRWWDIVQKLNLKQSSRSGVMVHTSM